MQTATSSYRADSCICIMLLVDESWRHHADAAIHHLDTAIKEVLCPQNLVRQCALRICMHSWTRLADEYSSFFRYGARD